jgi:HK97 family phage portal protein
MESILGPNGMPIKKDVSVLSQPSFTLMGSPEVGGAVPHPRRYDWKTYYEMYEKQPDVHAAINKLVKVATNTGFDFVARSMRTDVSDEEGNKARDFFEGLYGFKQELQTVYQHLLIFGDAFLFIVPNRKREPQRLKALAPWTVNIKVKKNGVVESYYQKDPDDPDGKKVVKYKAHEIIHIKMPNPKDQTFGLSLLESLKSAVLTDIMVERFNRKFFQNGASTGTVFIFNGASNDQLERMRKWIHEKYVGTENSHLPFVIDGDVRIERSIAENQDLGFLEGRAAIRAQILAVLDVPPAKLGYMESANRSNSKEQDKSFRTESVMPLQFLVESAISDQLIRDVLGLKNVLFNHSDADVRDRQEQMDLWKDGVQTGIMNINEVRKMMGLTEIDGGDINFVMTATGAVPVVDMELYFRLPSINTDKIPERLHDDHKHPKGNQTGINEVPHVGPDPKNDPGAQPRGAVGQSPSNKSLAAHPMFSLLSQETLEKAKTDEKVLRHTWANATDIFDDLQTPEAELIVKTLTKAVKTQDHDLALVYVERAQAVLHQIAK